MPLTTVSCKFNPEEMDVLARAAEFLRRRNPDLEPTRSDAVRFLVMSSGSALAGDQLPVTLTIPPGRPAASSPPDPREDRPAPG